MARITPSGAFGFYAGLCLLGYLFVVFCFPETAGLSLEEVRAVFAGGRRGGFWGTVREGARLRKVKQEMKRAKVRAV